MSEPISIRIPPALRRDLLRYCKREKKPMSDVAREALQRYLAVEQFRALRAKALPLAEAQGLLTDEDVFKAVS